MPASPPRSHTPKGRRARARILAAAERLLAARGFHGTSMRDVAAAARLPLATVVYHFARKEQLHAAVLEEIGGELGRELMGDAGATAARPAPRTTERREPERREPEQREPERREPEQREPEQRMDALARGLVRWSIRNPGRVRLLLRELLDNPARVARASRLPLAPVLTEATALVGAGARTHAFPELAVLHLVGAVSYVVAARPTVDRIVGPARAVELAAAYEREAIAYARRALGLSPSSGPASAPEPMLCSPSAAKEPHHAKRPPGLARPPRARPRRAEDDGHGRRAVDGPGGRVRR